MEQKTSDVNAPLLIVIGLTSAVLLFSVIVAIQAWYYSRQNYEYERKVVARQNQELADLTYDQQAQLLQTRWVDRQQGRVAIPIDRAVRQYVQSVHSGAQTDSTAVE